MRLTFGKQHDIICLVVHLPLRLQQAHQHRALQHQAQMPLGYKIDTADRRQLRLTVWGPMDQDALSHRACALLQGHLFTQ